MSISGMSSAAEPSARFPSPSASNAGFPSASPLAVSKSTLDAFAYDTTSLKSSSI
jgi:hypothetical protein